MVTQEWIVGQQHDCNHPTTRLQSQPQGDCTFMNYQAEDYFHMNHGGNDGVAHNIRSKRRDIDDDTPPLAN